MVWGVSGLRVFLKDLSSIGLPERVSARKVLSIANATLEGFQLNGDSYSFKAQVAREWDIPRL